MAKGKSANPADAHRKALRKKELNKNKTDRKKAREVAVVKKDTRSLEGDIRALSTKGGLSPSEQTELADLRAELARITKAKTEYVEAHPEHKKFVFPERGDSHKNAEASGSGELTTGLYTKDGKLRHPERSVYYDPVFNPFGAPPPGMPYKEKPPTPEEVAAFQPVAMVLDESEQESGEDDDDIALPAGPPPGSDDSSDNDSDDDIDMPAGPPPPRPGSSTDQAHRIAISRPSAPTQQRAYHPQPFHPDPHMRHGHFQPPPRPQRQFGIPPPSLPQRPHQDPLSNTPHVPFQAFRLSAPFQPSQSSFGAPPSHLLPPPGLPAPSPGLPPPPPSSLPPPPVVQRTAMPAATISAPPQLRDLKAEAVAFLPSTVRRRKPPVAPGAATLGAINAAPTSEEVGEVRERASLMGALKGVGIGPVQPGTERQEGPKGKGKEDYERFQREMEGFL